jgi:acetolactate synthase-1/2/3 large subunit
VDHPYPWLKYLAADELDDQTVDFDGMKIESPGDVEGALREAFKLKDRLVFLDMITDQAENVFPMIPGGKGLTEMIFAEEL